MINDALRSGPSPHHSQVGFVYFTLLKCLAQWGQQGFIAGKKIDSGYGSVQSMNRMDHLAQLLTKHGDKGLRAIFELPATVNRHSGRFIDNNQAVVLEDDVHGHAEQSGCGGTKKKARPGPG